MSDYLHRISMGSGGALHLLHFPSTTAMHSVSGGNDGYVTIKSLLYFHRLRRKIKGLIKWSSYLLFVLSNVVLDSAS